MDGTSLTVNGVDGPRFTVTLIPHSLSQTTWGASKAGDQVNLEVDMMAVTPPALRMPRIRLLNGPDNFRDNIHGHARPHD